MAKRKKNVELMTPVGTLVYPYLLVADSFKGEEKFKAKIRLPKSDPKTTELVEKLEAMLEAQKNKDTVLNDDEAYDYAEEYLAVEEDGDDMVLNAVLKRFGNKGKENEFEQAPAVFDSMGAPITDRKLQIYTGSTARLKIAPYAWSMDGKEGRNVGVSLRLKAAQVLTLAEKGERDADSYGFSAVEGGFDASQAENGDGVDTEGAEDY